MRGRRNDRRCYNKEGKLITVDLSGRVAVVTGANQGIGAVIASKLLEAGASVAAVDLKIENHNNYDANKYLSIESDVSDFDAAKTVVNQVLDRFGRIDIVVANAGINRDQVLWKMTKKNWSDVINVDLGGAFNYFAAAGSIMKKQESGKLIAISSINGLRGKFGQTNYSAAKAGVIGLVKAAAKELGKYSVRVNAIAPGFILTEMTNRMPEKFRNAAIDETVLKKAGSAEDIANAVIFLVSDLASHITGEVIKVDGGQYI